MRISTLSDFTIELDVVSPPGRNDFFYVAMYSNDLPTLTEVFNEFNAALQTIILVPGLSYSLSLQPIPTVITEHGDMNGGNVLGLEPSEGNLVCEYSIHLALLQLNKTQWPTSRHPSTLQVTWPLS